VVERYLEILNQINAVYLDLTKKLEKIGKKNFLIVIGLGLICLLNIFLVHSVPLYSLYIPSESKVITDEDLYAWAGWVYVHEGQLATVNPDHPPLAKYLIGLGITLFGDRMYMSLIFGFGLAIIIYLLGCRAGLPPKIAITASIILILDRLFVRLATTSLLDIFVTFFIYSATLVFLISLKRAGMFVLYGFVAGLAMACKWSALFFLLPLSIVGFVKTRSKWLLVGLLLFLGTYLASYTPLFLQGGTLDDFIKVQIFILENQQEYRLILRFIPQLQLNFLTGYSINYNILDQFGLFRVVPEHNPLTWPLMFGSAVLGIVYFFKDRNFARFVFNMMFWCGLISLFFIQGFIWYLLPLLPAGLLSLMFIFRASSNGKGERLKMDVFLVLLILVAFFAPYIPLPAEYILL